MKLCHRTDQVGRDGIEAEGFKQNDPPIGPSWDSPYRGIVWFASSKEVACKTCGRSGWWVWIDVPDDTPEYNLSDGEPYPGNYADLAERFSSSTAHSRALVPERSAAAARLHTSGFWSLKITIRSRAAGGPT